MLVIYTAETHTLLLFSEKCHSECYICQAGRKNDFLLLFDWKLFPQLRLVLISLKENAYETVFDAKMLAMIWMAAVLTWKRKIWTLIKYCSSVGFFDVRVLITSVWTQFLSLLLDMITLVLKLISTDELFSTRGTQNIYCNHDDPAHWLSGCIVGNVGVRRKQCYCK